MKNKINFKGVSLSFLITSLLIGTAFVQASAGPNKPEAILALDTEDKEGKTYKSFRTTRDVYVLERVNEISGGGLRILDVAVFEKSWGELTAEDKKGVLWQSIPTREGLDRQHVSGSGQFGKEGFTDIINCIKKTDFKGGIVVFDHREEPHAFLENGIPLSLYARADAYSIGKSWAELEAVERRFIQKIASQKNVRIHQITDKEEGVVTDTKTFLSPVRDVYNEKYLVKDLNGHGYVRIGITDHHRAMDDDLDDIIKTFDALPMGTWKHFHCRGGKGRTTTGMALFDIVSNHKNASLSFQDIMVRQYLIGGSNLLAIPTTDPAKQWKAKEAYERIRTIYKFYQRTNGQDLKTRQFYQDDVTSFQDSSSIKPD